MVTRVEINDKNNCAVKYICELQNFRNKRAWKFKPGVNIIVGENGSGKSTLMKIIEYYLLVGKRECERGIYNCNVTRLQGARLRFLDGAGVYADYDKNTFRLCHKQDKDNDDIMGNVNSFNAYFTQLHSSEGEGVVVSTLEMFNYIFSREARLKFNYGQFEESFPDYDKYIRSHSVECENEWTILMDEPDRNLSIDNIMQIESILSFHKPNTQIIAVIHNPLLIYKLSKNKDVHFIEMTKGYVKKVNGFINEMTGK